MRKDRYLFFCAWGNFRIFPLNNAPMLIFWLFARKNNACCNMYQNVPTLLYNNKLILKKT